MPRRERPLAAEDTALVRFAADLRRLRERAGSPPYRVLSNQAHYSAAALSEAAGGRKLPSLAVTLAFVQACAGDTAVWEARWRAVAAESSRELSRDEGQPRAPYVGLAAFQLDDADRFFGRDKLISELMAQVDQRRFVGVFGASGSGKSSLVRAGLMSRSDMPATVFTPGVRPIEECAVHMAALTGGSAALWRADLAADPVNLHLRIRQAMVNDESDLLLIVDQFEEVFTLCSDDERDWFIRALTFCAGTDSSRTRIVLGVRADFYGHCGQYPELVDALRGGHILVGAMAPEELREAITAPADRGGFKVETALVARLVADANGQPAVLPLVSHALLETWRRRHGMTLTVSGYEAAGGIHYAVAQTAEDLYTALDPGQRTAAQRLLLRLIAIGDGTEDTKRRIHIAELDDDPTTTAVLERLTQARLLVTGQDGVEIIHEALIRNWPRLRDWLTEDREGLRIHHQLTEASHTWESLNRDPGALYRGTRLARAHEWATTRDAVLTKREREFLNASVRARDDEEARARKRTRRLRQLVAVVVVFALLTATAAVVAVQQRSTAIQQRDDAVFRQVVAEADRLQDTDLSLSAQLNLVAHRMRPADQDVHTRLLATQKAPLATSLPGHTGNVYLTSFSPDGRTLATASEDKTARLWNVTDPTRPVPLGQPLTGHSGWVGTAVFSPDGRTLATAGDDGTVRLWNVTDPAKPVPLGQPLTAHDGTIYLAAFSPDGRLLATANENHTVRLWNLADPAHAVALNKPLTGPTGPVRSVAFSPDGHTVVAGGDDTTALLWNITDPAHPIQLAQRLTGHSRLVHSVAFSPDGRTLATGSQDNTVRLWNVADGALLGIPLTAHTGGVWSVTFAPDGHTLATASADGTARMWNVSDPANVVQLGPNLSGGSGGLYAAGFSPDGRTLATGSSDSTIRLWSLPTAVLIGHRSDVHSMAFSPNGDLIATGARDATVRLWNTIDPGHPIPLGQIPAAPGYLQSCSGNCTRIRFSPDGTMLAVVSHAKLVQLWNVTDPAHPTLIAPTLTLGTRYGAAALSFSPDGRILATGGHDEHSAQLWDISDPARPASLAQLTGHTGNITATVFSPDGRLIATAGLDHTIRLWDVTEPHQPRTVSQLNNAVASVAFSPDGRILASADQTIQLWNITNPNHPTPLGNELTGHSKGISSVVFSPDGRLVATASADQTIRLWDVSDPANPTRFGHPVRVFAGAGKDLPFSPDGHFLATIDGANTVRLLDLNVDHAIHRICATTHGQMSPQQREVHLPGLREQPHCDN